MQNWLRDLTMGAPEQALTRVEFVSQYMPQYAREYRW